MMLWMLAPVALVAQASAGPQAEIAAAMETSAAGWNAGSLDRFVAIYAPDAVFVGRDGLVRGRAAIADRYRASFEGGGNKRGRLRFEPLGFRRISPTHQVMWARWRLQPASGAEEVGLTTLLFERRPEGWRIISDHSS